MTASNKYAEKLIVLISKVIKDHGITGAEYEEIMSLEYGDAVLDRQERRLLSELLEMIANRSIQRVP